jgi:lipopolysaccharide transport system ATP-binding protein
MGGCHSMSAFVRVKNLSKTFALAEPGAGPVSLVAALRSGRREVTHREIQALEDVSFEIEDGERVGIIGRNGAGKTTLLSIIAGISQPSSGLVEIGGDVHAMLTIGAVLRDDATGRENIYLDGAIHGKSKEEIESHVSEIIAFTELGEFIDRPVRTYSSGMKARLAFGMGAFIDPDVLIIDETLAVGDAFFAQKALRKMREITAKGRIVIMVSHGLASIVEMCDRCLWLDQGRVVMDGPPDVVTAAYEVAVEQADETELKRKFEEGGLVPQRPGAGALCGFVLLQSQTQIAATARASEPLTIQISGLVAAPVGEVDLQLSIVRVDGRLLWRESLSDNGGQLPPSGRFQVEVRLDPFLLGANLYRLDALLMDSSSPIDFAARVIEVVDEVGQYGGVPLLFYPPVIAARPVEEAT